MAAATTEENETAEDRAAIAAINSGDDDGQSIEDMADALEEEESGQITLAGTKSSLTLNPGGRKPNMSRAKLRSISLPVSGQFEKGETLRLLVDVKVSDISFPDEEDSKGNVVRTLRAHTFKPVAIEVLKAE